MREEKIKRIIKNRGIKRLCHFTHVDNLNSILSQGIIPRAKLKEGEYRFNDIYRYDDCLNANCLSISYPNSRMFYKYSKDDRSQWAVIMINPEILYQFNCAFFSTNAASNSVRVKNLSDLFFRIQSDFFNEMFSRDDDTKDIPEEFPTDVQAEVLVFSTIPVTSIIEVHLYNEAERYKFSAKYPDIRFITSSSFYSDRKYYLNNFYRGN